MRILFGYRYGIVGGVCTQLYNRLRYLTGAEGVQAEICLGKDYGAAAMLRQLAPVHIPSPEDRAALLTDPSYDAVLIVDTPEMIREAAPSGRLIIEVHTTVERGLAYLEDSAFREGGFFVPSSYSSQLLQGRFGIRAEQISVVSNIVDAELFRPQPVDAPPRPIVSWVGKLDDHKRWPAFLEVATQLGLRHPDAEYWMFGGEAATDGVVEVLLDALAAGGLSDRARWFPRVEYAAMPRAHSAVAQSGGVTVVTSRDESFGMSVAEALLAGCPAVVPNVGALRELAPEAPYLLVYPDGDWAAAAHAASSLIGAAGDVARRALAADLPKMAARWSPEAVGPKLLQAIRQRLQNGSE